MFIFFSDEYGINKVKKYAKTSIFLTNIKLEKCLQKDIKSVLLCFLILFQPLQSSKVW